MIYKKYKKEIMVLKSEYLYPGDIKGIYKK
jgi:hypothetical protein